MIERHVDYLQASLWLSETAVIMKGFKPISPVRFYKRGYLMPNGFRLYFGNPNSKKTMAVAAGDVLQSLRNDQRLDAEIIGWILSQDGEISRLDLAVTEYVEDELLTIEDVEKWFKASLIESALTDGGCKTIASIYSDTENVRETLYIGDIKARGKKGLFRAYDKGIELGIGSELATRIELELKREKAHNVAKRLAESNDIAGNFRTHFNVKSRDFERLMDADVVKAVRGQGKAKTPELEALDKRWDWLLEQVAPALRQAVLDDRKHGLGDARFVDFMARAGILKDARDIVDALVKTKKMSTLDFD